MGESTQPEITGQSRSLSARLSDWRFLVACALWLATAVMLALHYAHLRADFPNYSPWNDWSKFTDEGWYGDAAIRHFQRGSWYLAGDFNPAVALPIWPILEGLLFAITGVSVTAARALSVSMLVLIVIAGAALLRQWSSLPRTETPLAPPLAALMLAASPFFYSFSRLAITEPLLILLALLVMLAATAARSSRWLPAVALGLLFPMMVLAKTTAVFIAPAIAWLLWGACGWSLPRFLRVAAPAGLLAAVVWGGYFGLIVHPHYLEDYRYLFAANTYTQAPWTADQVKLVAHNTFADGLWMGPLLYPLAVLAMVATLPSFFRRRANPLAGGLVLWALGYLFFIAYHANFQPRYYLVVAAPLTLLVPFTAERLWQRLRARNARGAEALLLGAAAIFAVLIWRDVRLTIRYVRHPEYTLVDAVQNIATIVRAEVARDPHRSSLILSISGSDISLMTGLPSICDDFGTLNLPDRVQRYRPGWYVAWNDVEDDKAEALAPLYRMVRIAEFPAMDDPDRNLLILYRLDPISAK